MAAVVVYRAVLALYCLGWLLYCAFTRNIKFLIHLTYWSFISVTLYFIISALVSLIALEERCNTHARHHLLPNTPFEERDSEPEDEHSSGSAISGMTSENSGTPAAWYHKALWVMFNISANGAVLVTATYWACLYKGYRLDGLDVNVHMLNSLFMFIETLVSAMPVKLFHAIYGFIFGLTYAIFTVIYWACGGTGSTHSYIYPFLDYEEHPTLAVCVLVGEGVVVQPLVQGLLYGVFKVRCFLSENYGMGRGRDDQLN